MKELRSDRRSIALRNAILDMIVVECPKLGIPLSEDESYKIVLMAGLEFTLAWTAGTAGNEEAQRLKRHIMQFFAEGITTFPFGRI